MHRLKIHGATSIWDGFSLWDEAALGTLPHHMNLQPLVNFHFLNKESISISLQAHKPRRNTSSKLQHFPVTAMGLWILANLKKIVAWVTLSISWADSKTRVGVDQRCVRGLDGGYGCTSTNKSSSVSQLYLIDLFGQIETIGAVWRIILSNLRDHCIFITSAHPCFQCLRSSNLCNFSPIHSKVNYANFAKHLHLKQNIAKFFGDWQN